MKNKYEKISNKGKLGNVNNKKRYNLVLLFLLLLIVVSLLINEFTSLWVVYGLLLVAVLIFDTNLIRNSSTSLLKVFLLGFLFIAIIFFLSTYASIHHYQVAYSEKYHSYPSENGLSEMATILIGLVLSAVVFIVHTVYISIIKYFKKS